jgi:hypothetical protein
MEISVCAPMSHAPIRNSVPLHRQISMNATAPGRLASFGAWLNSLPDWKFTATLFALRWLIILPLAALLSPWTSDADAFRAEGGPWRYLIPFLVVAPTLETLIECTLPYWLLHGWLKLSRRSVWPFVVVSATVMVLLHPLTPMVAVMAFITGAFLAYVYAHFAPQGGVKAFLHTAVFHAAINLVGFTMILISAMA